MAPLQGSCLCGGVRFEITQPFTNANHCHCSRCRKHSGTFGETQGRVPREGFRLLQGEELIRVYRPADGQFHTYIDSKAPWDELPDDGLPRYPDEPPG